jgi:hypothetical protein
MHIHREQTMKRATLLLGLAAASLTAACNPAKTGDYHGTFPDPPTLTGPSGADQTTLGMKVAYHHDYRRWSASAGTVGFGVASPSSGQLYSLWENLGYSLGGRSLDEMLDGTTFPAMVVGTVIGANDHVFLVNDSFATGVGLFGPNGPLIARLEPGFHTYHRTCTSAEGNLIEEVANNPHLTYDSAAAATEISGIDPILQACGLYVPPTFDLGTKVANTPVSDYGTTASVVTDMAWAPASDALYLLAGELLRHSVAILRYKPATQQLAQVGFGDYYAPLQVATGGTSLLVNRVGLNASYAGTTSLTDWVDRVRLPLAGSDQLSQARLPFGTNVQLGMSPLGILSPDGKTLAMLAPDLGTQPPIQLVDVDGSSVTNGKLAIGYPLAWDPSGTKLLFQAIDNPTSSRVLTLADGSLADLPADPAGPPLWPVFTTSMSAKYRVFWSATGPKALIQDVDGAQVYDLQTFKRTVVVEPSLVAPPSAPVDVVVATEQAFAWSMRCLGLGETSCATELRRLSLATGAVDVVARADAALGFAVSPDGTKLAIAYQDGLYLKDLPP